MLGSVWIATYQGHHVYVPDWMIWVIILGLVGVYFGGRS